ncbi:hypothetical protein [uncultured Shewanella sp.]|uniref:hypothetical protein n=1 Tax=uncultured Shewanella sp. TaxID=173975 RepID=UPI00261D8946|nr:hypothetical protein [uncultured Shewanella sp.]
MGKFFKVIVVLFTFLLLQACANTALTERTENQVYHGKPIDKLISDIGRPQAEWAEYNGDREYEWLFTQALQQNKQSRNGVSPFISNKAKLNSPQQCQFLVLTDEHNIIRSINFELDASNTGSKYSSMCIKALEKRGRVI